MTKIDKCICWIIWKFNPPPYNAAFASFSAKELNKSPKHNSVITENLTKYSKPCKTKHTLKLTVNARLQIDTGNNYIMFGITRQEHSFGAGQQQDQTTIPRMPDGMKILFWSADLGFVSNAILK
jgi:hypothetical protein